MVRLVQIPCFSRGFEVGRDFSLKLAQSIINKYSTNTETLTQCPFTLGVTDYPKQVNCILSRDLSVTKMSCGTV